jgi:hypothetical protein
VSRDTVLIFYLPAGRCGFICYLDGRSPRFWRFLVACHFSFWPREVGCEVFNNWKRRRRTFLSILRDLGSRQQHTAGSIHTTLYQCRETTNVSQEVQVLFEETYASIYSRFRLLLRIMELVCGAVTVMRPIPRPPCSGTPVCKLPLEVDSANRRNTRYLPCAGTRELSFSFSLNLWAMLRFACRVASHGTRRESR